MGQGKLLECKSLSGFALNPDRVKQKWRKIAARINRDIVKGVSSDRTASHFRDKSEKGDKYLAGSLATNGGADCRIFCRTRSAILSALAKVLRTIVNHMVIGFMMTF